MTRDELRTELAQRLGDSGNSIWSAAELARYIQQGYDALTLATGCLFATALLPDFPAQFTYTSVFEAEFITDGEYAIGPAQFTSMFERDYLDNAQGPANHNYPWEYLDGFVDTFMGRAVERLPEDLYQIERATWNSRRIAPLRSRDLEGLDSRYEMNAGAVEGYLQDKDGLRNLRKWRVPSSPYEPYSFDADSDDGFGIIRDLDGIADVDVDGLWGDLVSVDGVECFEDFGILGPIYKETNCVRIEYRRRGVPLYDTQQLFEIADRYVIYVRNFAQARALEREGPGQEKELAAFYQSRYFAGVERMKRRQSAMQYQRASIMGGSPKVSGRRLAGFGYPYPAAVR